MGFVFVSGRPNPRNQRKKAAFMKLWFKQRMFSWFDSYDIYDENGQTMFVVKGALSWGTLPAHL